MQGAKADLTAVQRAISRGQRALWETQRPDGSWDSPGELGPITTAQAVIALHYVGRLDAADRSDAARWLRSQQRHDGSFVQRPYAKEGEVCATASAWAALTFDGAESREAAARAKAWLDAHGGLDAVVAAIELGDFSAIFLAMAGLLDPHQLPCPNTTPLLLPPVRCFLETRFHAGVLMTAFAIEVLVRHLRGEWRPGDLGLRARLTRRQCIELLGVWQNQDGSWIDSVVFTSFLLPAVVAAGKALSDPMVVRGAEWLLSQRTRDLRGLRFNAFGMEVWVTGFEISAMLGSGIAPSDPDLERALKWLADAQSMIPVPVANNRQPGALLSGGWALERTNHTMADCDDTGVVLAALGDALGSRRAQPMTPALEAKLQTAVRRGEDWVLGMQNPDGGWSAYVWGLPGKKPGPTLETTPRVRLDDPLAMAALALDPPASVSDPSTEDVTARVLHGLGKLGRNTADAAVRRAVEFLRVQQCGSGAWWGRWAVNYVNGTAFVLIGLAAVKADLTAEWVQRGVRWLKSVQNADGGWSEGPDSYRDPARVGGGASMPPLTGLVLQSLVAAGEGDSDAARRAATYLLKSQSADGSWPNRDYLHTNIPPDTFYVLSAAATFYPIAGLGSFLAQQRDRPAAPASPRWSDALLDPSRHHTDPVADSVVKAIFASGSVAAVNRLMADIFRSDGPLPGELPGQALDYFQETEALPKWADADKLKRAQELFERCGWPIAAGLFCSSLPQAYAAAHGAHVLTQTQQMTRHVRQRIFETAQFLFDVMDDGALLPAGRGIRAAQKVRLMHAGVRHLVLARPTPAWDTAKLGLPVNQEDLAGTLMTFSVVTLDALQKLEMPVSESEAEAWLHAWKVIGTLLGLNEELLPSDVADGRALMERIRDRQWASSPDGQALARPLIGMMQDYFPERAVDGLPVALVRHLAGDHCADLLGLPPADWTRLLLEGALVFDRLIDLPDLDGRTGRLIDAALHRLMEGVVLAEREGKQAKFRIPVSLRRAPAIPRSR